MRNHAKNVQKLQSKKVEQIESQISQSHFLNNLKGQNGKGLTKL